MKGRAALLLGGSALAVAVAACGGSSAGSSPTSASCSAGTAAVSQGGSPGSTVDATDNLAFSPQTVTVNVGQVVQWKNTGQIAHTVTFSGAQSCLTDDQLGGGSTWDVTFNQAGTFAFKCTIHPQMTGVVTVH
jgi:plastocyanin